MTDGPSRVLIVDVGRRAVATNIAISGPVTGMMFSSDASHVAVGLGATFAVFETKTGREIFQATIPNNRRGLQPIAFGSSIVVTDAEWTFAAFDAVLIVTDHTLLDRERLLREANIIIDTRDSLRGVAGDRRKVYGL